MSLIEKIHGSYVHQRRSVLLARPVLKFGRSLHFITRLDVCK